MDVHSGDEGRSGTDPQQMRSWYHDAMVKAESLTLACPHVVVCVDESGLVGLEGPYRNALDAIAAASREQETYGNGTVAFVPLPLLPPPSSDDGTPPVLPLVPPVDG
jgi:hypothetical protein